MKLNKFLTNLLSIEALYSSYGWSKIGKSFKKSNLTDVNICDKLISIQYNMMKTQIIHMLIKIFFLAFKLFIIGYFSQ